MMNHLLVELKEIIMQRVQQEVKSLNFEVLEENKIQNHIFKEILFYKS